MANFETVLKQELEQFVEDIDYHVNLDSIEADKMATIVDARCKSIMSKVPEPFEVFIEEEPGGGMFVIYHDDFATINKITAFIDEQAAIDFCNNHGFKIDND